MSQVVLYEKMGQGELDRLITDPPIRPCGDFILIRVEDIQTTTAGGIALPDKMVDREQKGAGVGYIVAIGPYAWSDDDEPWAKAGDKVVFNRYEGVVPPVDGMDDGKLRLINDNKVLGVFP